MGTYERGWDGAYNVDDNNLAIKVDSDAVEADACSESLRVTAQPWLVQRRGKGVREEDPSSRVLAKAKVVVEHALDKFMAGLVVVGDVIKGLINGCKEGVVCVGVVEKLAKLVVFADQLEKLGGLVALLEDLPDGQVGKIKTEKVEGSLGGMAVIHRFLELLVHGVGDFGREMLDCLVDGSSDARGQLL